MKKVIMSLLTIFIASYAYASADKIEICGPAVTDKSYAYTYVEPLASGKKIGFWAIGPNCSSASVTNILGVNGTVSAELVNGMCGGDSSDNIIVRGQAICISNYWATGTTEFDESSQTEGPYCFCRRTKMINTDGNLVDSIGMWILIGNTQNAVESCLQGCPQLCARNVAYDAAHNDGHVAAGNAIMVMPVN